MYSPLSIIPPLLVITCALITRRMILSFLVGIITAAFIATSGSFYETFALGTQRFIENTGLHKLSSVKEILSNWNLAIFVFLLSLGILIGMLQRAGGTQAFQRVVNRWVKSCCSTEIASLLLSIVFFIDDYLSALTVGSIMRPLAQVHKVHPVKLAFLVTAMAQPITILSPLSSWVGEIIVQLKQVGIEPAGPNATVLADPFYVFVRAIPFIFYAFFMIVTSWYIVLRRISYGPMVCYETPSYNPEQIVFGVEQTPQQSSVLDFLFPLCTLISLVFFTLLITGDYSFLSNTVSFAQALKNGSMHQALLIGGLGSILLSSIFFILRARFKPSTLITILKEGMLLMTPSIIMLIHAWTLSALLKQDLNTGSYIATVFAPLVNTLFFPLICFIFSALIAWMIGSAWATIGLMLPIALPMLKTLLSLPVPVLLNEIPLLLPALGAILSGCIMGTHCSFISDNPIMSSASTGAVHFEHVKTMLWYVMPAALASVVAYSAIGLSITIFGLFKALIFTLLAGGLLTVLFLEIASYLFGKNKTR